MLSYEGQKDSTWIDVAYDPRIPIPQEVLAQKYGLQKEIEKKMDLCSRATERLIESREIAEDYKKSANKIDKKAYENIVKSSDSVIKKINGFMDDLMGKEDKRQGITATEKPSNISYLYQARSYVNFYLRSAGWAWRHRRTITS